MQESYSVEAKKEYLKIAKTGWQEAKEFAIDEGMGAMFAMAGTKIASLFGASAGLLTVSGVVTEKGGLFARTFKEKYSELSNKKLTLQERKGFMKAVWQGGLPSLRKDLMMHDPLYMALFYAASQTYPEIDVLISSGVSFVVALGITIGIDNWGIEALHSLQKKRIINNGYISKQYYEAKLFVNQPGKELEILNDLATEFKLDVREARTYNDTYYHLNNKIKGFNQREKKLRKRERISRMGGEKESEVSQQIVFTKSNQAYCKETQADRYNFFPIKKEKITIPKELGKEASILQKYTTGEIERLFSFDRTFAYDPSHDGMYAGVDVSPSIKNGFFLEIKGFHNIQKIITMCRYVLEKYPSRQFNIGKEQLIPAK